MCQIRNWKGAKTDPALLQELMEEDISAGFFYEASSPEAAFGRRGKDGVSVG